MHKNHFKKPILVAGAIAVVAALILLVATRFGIRIPFLLHKLPAFPDAIEVLIGAAFLVWVIGLLVWGLCLSAVRYPFLCLGAALVWYGIYHLYKDTELGDDTFRVVFCGAFFIFLICGMARYVEHQSAIGLRRSNSQELIENMWRKLRTQYRPLLVIVCVAAFGAFTVWTWLYSQVEGHTRRMEILAIRPRVSEGMIAEVGYVWDVRNEILWKERSRRIMWWVKIPSTGKIYSCSWENGSSQFLKGDDVKLIHKEFGVEQDDYSGFIVGLNGERKSKASEVWAIDTDDLPAGDEDQ